MVCCLGQVQGLFAWFVQNLAIFCGILQQVVLFCVVDAIMMIIETVLEMAVAVISQQEGFYLPLIVIVMQFILTKSSKQINYFKYS